MASSGQEKLTKNKRAIEELKALVEDYKPVSSISTSKKKKRKRLGKKIDQEKSLSAQIQKLRPPPEVIIFNDPAKRAKKVKSQDETNTKEAESSSSMISLREVKHDVLMFGMKALDPNSKEEAKVSLLVSLGAEPPKKECKNYKKFQAEQKLKKREEAEKRDMLRNLGFAEKAQKARKKKKQDINDVGGLDGQAGGMYKDGVLVVKKAAMMKNRDR